MAKRITQPSATNEKEYFKSQHDKVFDMLAEKRANRDERQAELEVLNQEIVQLETLLKVLTPFVTDAPTKPDAVLTAASLESFSLADACREVLKSTSDYKTPRAIRDSLEISGYNLKQHANALASIHGVLKRMLESGELEQIDSNGKIFYRWKSAVFVKSSAGSGKLAEFLHATAVEATAAQAVGNLMKMESTAAGRAMRRAIEEAEKMNRRR